MAALAWCRPRVPPPPYAKSLLRNLSSVLHENITALCSPQQLLCWTKTLQSRSIQLTSRRIHTIPEMSAEVYKQCCDPGVTWEGTTHGKVMCDHSTSFRILLAEMKWCVVGVLLHCKLMSFGAPLGRNLHSWLRLLRSHRRRHGIDVQRQQRVQRET